MRNSIYIKRWREGVYTAYPRLDTGTSFHPHFPVTCLDSNIPNDATLNMTSNANPGINAPHSSHKVSAHIPPPLSADRIQLDRHKDTLHPALTPPPLLRPRLHPQAPLPLPDDPLAEII